MAYSLEKKDLTPQQTQTLVCSLVFSPKEKYTKNKFVTPKAAIAFYGQQEGRVQVPFAFAANFFGVQPGMNRQYAKAVFDFNGKPRENQLRAIAASEQYLSTTASCILSIPPGAGKTFIGAYLAHSKGLLTLVVHPKPLALGTQWQTTFNNFTTATSWIVGDPIPNKPIDVIICINKRFGKIPVELRKKIGFVIFDEAHLLCTPESIEMLLGTEPRYVLAETATLTRPDGMDILIRCICGNNIVDEFERKAFLLTRCITNIVPEVEKTAAGDTNWNVLTKSLLYSPERNAMILSIVAAYPERKIAILTCEREHAIFLVEELKKKGEGADYFIGGKETYEELRILVGTVPKIGTGFDEANYCVNFSGHPIDLVILVVTFDNPAVYDQNFGRGFRSDDPLAFLITDRYPSIDKHWGKAQKWALQSNGKVCQKTFVKKEGVYVLE